MGGMDLQREVEFLVFGESLAKGRVSGPGEKGGVQGDKEGVRLEDEGRGKSRA